MMFPIRFFTRTLQVVGTAALCAMPLAAHADFEIEDYVRTPSGNNVVNGMVHISFNFTDTVSACEETSTGFAGFRAVFTDLRGGYPTVIESASQDYQEADLDGSYEVHLSAFLPAGFRADQVDIYCYDAYFMQFINMQNVEMGSGEWDEPLFIVQHGPFAVVDGGTGADTFTTNGVLLGNATSSIQATAAGSANQTLIIPAGGGSPVFGALDLSQTAAVTGTLPVVRGGTGSATAFTQGSLVFAGSGGAYLQDNGNLFWDDANNRLGIGTSSPQSRLEVNGTSASLHQKGIGSTPSLTLGTGAGTGASGSITGTDAAGAVSVTLGLLPASNAAVATITFATPHGTAPYVIFSPASTDAAALYNARAVHVTATTTSFTIVSGSTALLASGDLVWNYQVVE